MTAPAPSPGPAKRSRRLYVCWGAALALLVTAGLVCWLVVVPVWQVRRELPPLPERTKCWSAAYRKAVLASVKSRRLEYVAPTETPYDGKDEADRKSFLEVHRQAWDAVVLSADRDFFKGRTGLTFSTYCFQPMPATEGWCTGQRDASMHLEVMRSLFGYDRKVVKQVEELKKAIREERAKQKDKSE